MTQSHALDLRVRVAGFVEAGHSRRAAARHSHGRTRVNRIVSGLRLHGLSPRVGTDPRLSLFPIRAFLARLKLTCGRRPGRLHPHPAYGG